MHQRWLVAACGTALAWAYLVHLRISDSSHLAAVFCLGWLALSAKAMGAELLPRLGQGWRERAREVALGAGLGAGLVALSLGVGALCESSSLGLCGPVRTLTSRAAGVELLAMLGIGAVIVPAEELFWHGTVHAALRPRVGRVASAGLSTLCLCVSYLLFGEWELALVALPTFLLWGLLAEWRGSLVAALTSHLVWTVFTVTLIADRMPRAQNP
jgi:membrane protease YdiL (CAAX protease family)